MTYIQAEFQACRATSEALLQRSRAARVGSVGLRSQARATCEAVIDLIRQAHAIKAFLNVADRRRVADRQPRTPGTACPAHEPATIRGPLEGAPTVAQVTAADFVERTLAAAGLQAGDLDDLLEDLSAAYVDAQAWGDEEVRALLQSVLSQIGRDLAQRLGPKVAGVSMS